MVRVVAHRVELSICTYFLSCCPIFFCPERTSIPRLYPAAANQRGAYRGTANQSGAYHGTANQSEAFHGRTKLSNTGHGVGCYRAARVIRLRHVLSKFRLPISSIPLHESLNSNQTILLPLYLVVRAVGTRHELSEFLVGREPSFQVVLLDRGIVQLPRHDVHHPVRNA